MRVRPRLLALVVAVGLLGAACERPADDETVRPQWQAVELPMPPGPPGRLMLRDAAACGGRWYVVGAIAGSADATRPAAWTSTDATTWRALSLRPISYYGERAILYAVGCYQDSIAVIGAKVGGAHGNPRVRTWRQATDGTLVEVAAEFELYGGWSAVNVSRVAGGPGGWLIAGGRQSGAAVWHSPDASDFDLLEGVPPLASDARMNTSASDALPVESGWLVGGSGRSPGRTDRDPVVWSSPDARIWGRQVLPATSDDEAVQRLVRGEEGVVALGVRGQAFAAWRSADDPGPGQARTWEDPATFGSTGVGTLAAVHSAAVDHALVVALSVGSDGHRMWSTSGGSWRPVVLPVRVPSGGDAATALAAAADRVLVTTDDGTTAGVWIGSVSRSVSAAD